MKIEVIEDKKDLTKLELHDDLTIVNVIHEKVWKNKGISSYNKKHPELDNPKITIKGGGAKTTLKSAADDFISEIKEFKKQFKRTMK